MRSSVLQDLSFAFRYFRRSPAFTLAVVLTLALGIGATTAIFSLVDGILVRPLPFPGAERLVAINTLEFPPGIAPTNVAAANSLLSSYPDFFDWQRADHSFVSLASYDIQYRLFSKANGQGARVIVNGRISENLFSTLGVAPALGRSFTAEEEQPGHRVVILSHELWVSDFASSPDAIGQQVKMSDWPSTIVGVMPAGFHYPPGQPALFWTSYAADAEGTAPLTSQRDGDRLAIVGRLHPGVAIPQALAELNTIQRGLAQQYTEIRYRSAVAIQPLLSEAVGDARATLLLLLAAAGFVLLIGCANVAGLLLARSAARRPEVALRTALGASRGRVIRQLLIEALLLALAGGVAGILLSFVLLRAGLRYIPSAVPRLYNISIDGRVLAFAFVVSAATALLFGLLPAWRMSQADPATALRDYGTSMTSGRRRNRLHHALVVAETALGFTLLVGSGLLIKSLVNILHLDPGFDTKRTVFFDVALTNKRYPDPTKVAFYDRLLPELEALPGVERVAAGHPLPSRGSRGEWNAFTIAGHVYSPDDLPGADAAAVTPGFFEALSIPLCRGRTFTRSDNDPKSAPVAIINRSLAKQYYPGEDPIGRYFTPAFDPTTERVLARQIVGIVGDTRSGDPSDPYQPIFFLPYAQHPTHQRVMVVMKVAGDADIYENAVRAIVARFDKDAPVFGYETFASSLDAQAAQPRFEAALVSVFAAIALLLSALGLYAVLSYIVAERTRELGLRMALGASRADILQLVAYRAVMLACVGVGCGALVSVAAAHLIADILLNVAPLDRSVFLGVAVVLSLVSLLAAVAPALRAARVDPIRTLRQQ